MNCGAEAIDEQRAEEESFLLGVREGIAANITFVERGGIPMNWRGCGKAEILARLHRHQDNVTRAIQHVRTGGDLEDIVGIVWGRINS